MSPGWDLGFVCGKTPFEAHKQPILFMHIFLRFVCPTLRVAISPGYSLAGGSTYNARSSHYPLSARVAAIHTLTNITDVVLAQSFQAHKLSVVPRHTAFIAEHLPLSSYSSSSHFTTISNLQIRFVPFDRASNLSHSGTATYLLRSQTCPSGYYHGY